MTTESGATPSSPSLRAKVLTVSDGVSAGTREDKSGRALVERLTEVGFEVIDHRLCADGAEPVAIELAKARLIGQP